MSSIISALNQGRRSLFPDSGGLHGLGQTLPVVVTVAQAPELPAAAAAAVQEAVDEAAPEVPSKSGHDSGGSSAVSAGDSEVSSLSAARCRKSDGTVHQDSLAKHQKSDSAQSPSCSSKRLPRHTAAPTAGRSPSPERTSPPPPDRVDPRTCAGTEEQSSGMQLSLRLSSGRTGHLRLKMEVPAPAKRASRSESAKLEQQQAHGTSTLGLSLGTGGAAGAESQGPGRNTQLERPLRHAYPECEVSSRGPGYWICLGCLRNVRIFMLSPGVYMVSLQDCFAAAGNDNPTTGWNFVSRGSWAVGQPCAGRLVNTRHMVKKGNPVSFAPAEVALDIIKAWWGGERSPATRLKTADSVQLFVGDLEALITEVKEKTTTAGVASTEELAELGATAVCAHSGAPTAPSHMDMSTGVETFRWDAFPMYSMQDSPRVQLSKLTTAVTNMMAILKPDPAVQGEVWHKVGALDEVGLRFYMDVHYVLLRTAGMAKRCGLLGIAMRQLLQMKTTD